MTSYKTFIQFGNKAYLANYGEGHRTFDLERAMHFDGSAKAIEAAEQLGIKELFYVVKICFTHEIVEIRTVQPTMTVESTSVLTKYKINEIDRERGSAPDITSYYYDVEQKARDHVTTTNAKNTLTTVPDFYTVAEYIGKVEGIMVNGKFRELK